MGEGHNDGPASSGPGCSPDGHHPPEPPPPPPPPLACQLELAPLGSALSPLRWRVNLGASHGEGVYKRKHRPW